MDITKIIRSVGIVSSISLINGCAIDYMDEKVGLFFERKAWYEKALPEDKDFLGKRYLDKREEQEKLLQE